MKLALVDQIPPVYSYIHSTYSVGIVGKSPYVMMLEEVVSCGWIRDSGEEQG